MANLLVLFDGKVVCKSKLELIRAINGNAELVYKYSTNEELEAYIKTKLPQCKTDSSIVKELNQIIEAMRKERKAMQPLSTTGLRCGALGKGDKLLFHIGELVSNSLATYGDELREKIDPDVYNDLELISRDPVRLIKSNCLRTYRATKN